MIILYIYYLIFENYINQHSIVNIICPMHGIFNQLAHNHTSGYGCPICNESIGEKNIRIFLENNGILFNQEKNFKNCIYKKYLFFDFYLPDYNICIEYDGIQHFEIVEYFGGIKTYEENLKRDKIKNEYCQSNNIHLIRISYKDNINDILNQEFANFLKSSALLTLTTSTE